MNLKSILNLLGILLGIFSVSFFPPLALTFIYPEQPSYSDKVKMQQFMKSISYILPCKYCRISFAKYSISLPIIDYLDNREKMIEWLYKIHNKVNKKLIKHVSSNTYCKLHLKNLNNVSNYILVSLFCKMS